MRTFNIFASGLGLLFSSRGAVGSLAVDGAAVDESKYETLVTSNRIFAVDTGSPELDYEIHLHERPWSTDVKETFENILVAPLVVEGGAVVIRDGYDLEEWMEHPEELVVFDIEDGRYRVHVASACSIQHTTMILHLYFEETEQLAAAEGYYLPFKPPPAM